MKLRSFYMFIAIWMSSFVWCLMKSFAPPSLFFIEWSVFFLQICRSFLCSEYKSFNGYLYCKYLLSLSYLGFLSFNGSFWWPEMTFNAELIICSLVLVPFVYSRNLCFSKVMKIFFFIVLFHIWVYMTWNQFSQVSWKWGSRIFSHGYQIDLVPLIEKTVLFSTSLQYYLFHKSGDSVGMGSFLGSSVPLTC